MRLNKLSQFILALSSTFTLSTFAFADQTTGEKLVGQSYLGGHLIFVNADGDRLFTHSSQSSIDYGSGAGVEYGFRFKPEFEFRLSYSHLNIDTEKEGYNVPSGKNVAADFLYFPYQESFYMVGGANALDIEGTDLSLGLGAGYRYHFNDNMAIYLEGQGAYQFNNGFAETISKLGFVYYFGESKSTPSKRKKEKTAPAETAAVATAVAVQDGDADMDGVKDSKDQCPNTPKVDRVDSQGCTQFESVELTKSLSINFDNDKDVIKPKYKSEVAELAEFMNKYNHVSVTINGHTSARGDATYNQQLSERRAQAVVDMLENEFGIASNRLSAYGHGENQLLESGNSEAAHAANRRIEAKVAVKVKQAVKK